MSLRRLLSLIRWLPAGAALHRAIEANPPEEPRPPRVHSSGAEIAAFVRRTGGELG